MFTRETKGPYVPGLRCTTCNYTKVYYWGELGEKTELFKTVCIECGAFEQKERVVARESYSQNRLSLEERPLRIEVDRVLTG